MSENKPHSFIERGYVCDGCGRFARDTQADMDKLHAGGFLSCCPERKMKPVIFREDAEKLREALIAARPYVECYDTREHNTEQDATLTKIDKALGGARS